jgi:hypothetical protein
MAEIIKFPTSGERAWPDVEQKIRSVLLKMGSFPSLVDWICADLKPRWLMAITAATNPNEFPEANVIDRVHGAMIEQMITLEIELYKEKFFPNQGV